MKLFEIIIQNIILKVSASLLEIILSQSGLHWYSSTWFSKDIVTITVI